MIEPIVGDLDIGHIILTCLGFYLGYLALKNRRAYMILKDSTERKLNDGD